MRVLMLTSSYPMGPGDWRGGFVREFGKALMARGMDVEVAVPRPAEMDHAPEYGEDEPRTLWLPSLLPGRARGFHGYGLESNLARDPLASLSVPPFLMAYTAETLVRAAFADCLVAHWLFPMGAVGAVVSRLTGKPFLIVAHSGPPPAARLPPFRQVVRFTLGRASWVACVSDSVRREVRRVAGDLCRDNLTTIPLGVDLRPSISPPRGRNKELRLLFVGRLVKIKGLDVLLHALKGTNGVTLRVLGDGPRRGDLEKASSAGVRFEGEVPHGRVIEAMQTHDAVVIPSRTGLFGRVEGLPRTLLEAWSCGLPAIAAATGGLEPAIHEHGGGLLFRPGDVNDLVRVVNGFRTDAALRARLRREALMAAKGFSWQVLGPKWAELIGRFG